MKIPASWLREFCAPRHGARELADLLTMSGVEVETLDALPGGEHVFTFKLTPNRGDCLSVLGIAREVAALTGAKNLYKKIKPVRATSKATHPVRISAPEGCGRFAGRVIRNVNAAAPTPAWMRERLERAGQRPISALVDVTNYVMLELGRPLHVYDLDKLRGAIEVRWGRAGERVRLLNEEEVVVDPLVLCITDDSGPIGLGGVMGGDSTKADTATRHVFLESAFFFPEAVAGRAGRFTLASEAAHRFERGVDFDNNLDGIERATRLILDICGGEPGPATDLVKRLPKRKPVRMRVARAQKVIGIPVSAKQMSAVFRNLSLPFTLKGEAFTVKPPSFRFDLEIEEDLIEEVARVHGFARIPAAPPRAPARMAPLAEARRPVHALRERLAALDYQEVINFSFVEPQREADLAGVADPIRLLNPIASQLSVMRTSLIGSLVGSLQYNHARKLARTRVFEIGRAFLRDPAAGDGPLEVAGLRQPLRIAAAASGPAVEEQWGVPTRPVDFFDAKADLEALVAPLAVRLEPAPHPAFHPGRSARVLVEGRPAGWIGELHPRWQSKYALTSPAAMFEVDGQAIESIGIPRPSVPPKFPAVTRDISVLVPSGLLAQELLDAMHAARPPIVQAVELFDFYQGSELGQGRKSLAFRVVMQDTERTLTDTEADAARDALVALLQSRFSASLRK